MSLCCAVTAPWLLASRTLRTGVASAYLINRPGAIPWSRAVAGEILANGRYLLDVIQNVLELSRLEAGRYDVADDKVDLALVVRECLGMIRLRAEKNRISLNCAIADDELMVRAGSQAVKRVILNLLTNAVKFTPAGGTVSTCAERAANGDFAVTGANAGIGIDP
jgi:signal transduction histidine kinase